MKYARAAAWIFAAWLLRRLRLPIRWVHEAEDQASLRMYACSLDFDPVEIARPIGYRCTHVTVTSSAGIVQPQPCWQGCEMRPYFATEAA